MTERSFYLPELTPHRMHAEGLDRPYWEAARRNELAIQRCRACGGYQWGPEWICHRCHSFDVSFDPVDPVGRLFSWERIWHPVHPDLAATVPYVVVLVELPHADGVRVLGNLLGDATAPIETDAPLRAVFEHHDEYTLVQWERS